MKIRHNAPREPRSADLTPEYEAEVEASMRRGRLRWESEQTALEKAERRRAKVAARKPKTAKAAKVRKRQLRELDELIELHRQRLQETHRMMRSSPQSAAHRGDKSFRPVPNLSEPI